MSNLSNLSKEIIREFAKQPNTNVYAVYAEVLKYCSKSGYSTEQVGNYLRYVKRAIIRSRVISASSPHLSLNVPHVTDSLTVTSPHLSKKTLEEIKVRSNRG